MASKSGREVCCSTANTDRPTPTMVMGPARSITEKLAKHMKNRKLFQQGWLLVSSPPSSLGGSHHRNRNELWGLHNRCAPQSRRARDTRFPRLHRGRWSLKPQGHRPPLKDMGWWKWRVGGGPPLLHSPGPQHLAVPECAPSQGPGSVSSALKLCSEQDSISRCAQLSFPNKIKDMLYYLLST